MTNPTWPRIRDLPPHEQAPFSLWLDGQTRPMPDHPGPEQEWDWYFPWDYDRWRRGAAIID